MRSVIFLIFVFSISLISAQQRQWKVFNSDSTLVANHYWNESKESLDSLVMVSNREYWKYRFTPIKDELRRQYQEIYTEDSLSAPYDFKIPTITKMWHFDDSHIAIVGKNKGESFHFRHYLHFVLLDKKTLKTDLWITFLNPRGYGDIVLLIDSKRKKIWLPKEQNFIRENKIYRLNMEKETFKEIYLKKEKTKYIRTIDHNYLKSGVFEICY